MTDKKTFNVVEVTAPGPFNGRVVVVPSRKPGRLKLRNACYRLCNVPFDFADGSACGIVTERRAQRSATRVGTW